MKTRTHRRICVLVVAIVTQCHIPDTQPVIHPQHTRAVHNLMQALNADQTSDSAGAEYRQDIVGALGKGKLPRVLFDEVVDQVDLLQSLQKGGNIGGSRKIICSRLAVIG